MYGVLKFLKHNLREQEEMNGNKTTLKILKNETTRQTIVDHCLDNLYLILHMQLMKGVIYTMICQEFCGIHSVQDLFCFTMFVCLQSLQLTISTLGVTMYSLYKIANILRHCSGDLLVELLFLSYVDLNQHHWYTTTPKI